MWNYCVVAESDSIEDNAMPVKRKREADGTVFFVDFYRDPIWNSGSFSFHKSAQYECF